MRRRVRAMLTYLILGAMLNVAVAWGIVIAHGDLWMGATPVCVMHNDKEIFMFRRQLTGHAVMWGVTDGVPWNRDTRPDWCVVQDPWWPPRLFDCVETRAVLVACGWPFLTLAAWQIDDRPFDWALVDEPDDQFAWLLKTNGQSLPLVVPYRPVLRGVVLNTCIYGSAIWCAVCGPRAVRAVIRRRRGLCARCAYPRESHAICPECGTVHKRGISDAAHAAPPA